LLARLFNAATLQVILFNDNLLIDYSYFLPAFHVLGSSEDKLSNKRRPVWTSETNNGNS
jgi:hypothetical protein